MDETYIKMCDCPEIQGGHETLDGERYAFRTANGEWHTMVFCSVCDDGLPVVEVWLPRQKDIQGFFGEPKDEDYWPDFLLAALISPFFYFCHPLEAGEDDWIEKERYVNKFMSMDQLWLAFYMHKVHNKTWTEKGWA